MKAAMTISSNTNALGIKADHQQQAVIKDEGYVTQSRNTSFSSAGEYSSTAAANTDIEDVASMVDPDIWSTTLQQNIGSANNIHPLDATSLMMSNWESQIFTDDLETQVWEDLTFSQQQPQQSEPLQQQQQAIKDNGVDKNYTFHQVVRDTSIFNNDYMLQQMNPFAYSNNNNNNTMFNGALYHSAPPTASTTPNGSSSTSSSHSSGLFTPPMTNYFQQRSSLPTTTTTTNNKRLIYMNNTALNMNPRRSSMGETTRLQHPHPRLGRRASSNPSVASVVSLTAHEPISKIIDGIEYITFLYSHDRLVKEYTVRTDVDHVNLDDIVIDFRIQNAVGLLCATDRLLNNDSHTNLIYMCVDLS